MINDTLGGGEDEVAKLTRGEQVVRHLFNVADLHVKAGGDNSDLVDAANQLHNL